MASKEVRRNNSNNQRVDRRRRIEFRGLNQVGIYLVVNRDRLDKR